MPRTSQLASVGCAVILCALVAACAGTPEAPTGQTPALTDHARNGQSERSPATPTHAARRPDVTPRIVSSSRRQQCVTFARRHSGIGLRGDAWTWWRSANRSYQRGHRPAVGSVLVLKRKRGSRGHLAVVRRIVSDREIVVDHANWLNRGRIHLQTPVRDVSRNNDWSALRVWYTPGRQFGTSTYAAYGFIYPRQVAGIQPKK